MKFTKAQIDLSLQIAERYRKPIEYGDFYLGKNGDIRSWQYKYKTIHKDLIPLLSLSDCLEFLNQHDAHCVLLGWTGKTKRSKKYCHEVLKTKNK